MTRGCRLCQRSPATRCLWCKLRFCAEHELRHDCPPQQAIAMAADDPTLKKRALAERAPEESMTAAVVDGLNALQDIELAWQSRKRGGFRANDGARSVADVTALSRPDGRHVEVEMKGTHKDGCVCDSCTDQRQRGERVRAAGGVYVSGVRKPQDAIDGVLMGLARARGPRAHDRVRCLRCGHVWKSRLASGQIPKQCGLCLSPSAGENGETMIVAVALDAERSAG